MNGMLMERAKQMSELVEPMRGTVAWHTPHWCESKLLAVRFYGRRPVGLREWARFLWNLDLFFGPIPLIKPLVLLAIVGIVH